MEKEKDAEGHWELADCIENDPDFMDQHEIDTHDFLKENDPEFYEVYKKYAGEID